MVLTLSIFSEGLAPWTALIEAPLKGLPFLLLTSANAAVLNTTGMIVTKELGALGQQLIGALKSVLTVVGGAVVYAEPISYQQFAAYTILVLGIAWYNTMEKGLKD